MIYKKTTPPYDFRNNNCHNDCHKDFCRRDCYFQEPFFPPPDNCPPFNCTPTMPHCGYCGYIGNFPPFFPPPDNCPPQPMPRIYFGINFCITQQSNKQKK